MSKTSVRVLASYLSKEESQVVQGTFNLTGGSSASSSSSAGRSDFNHMSVETKKDEEDKKQNHLVKQNSA